MVLKDTCPVVRSYISSREIHSCAIITGYWSRRVKSLYFKTVLGRCCFGFVLVCYGGNKVRVRVRVKRFVSVMMSLSQRALK